MNITSENTDVFAADLERFLSDVLPPTGHFILAHKIGGALHGAHWFSSHADLADAIRAKSNAVEECWFSPASYVTEATKQGSSGRSKQNVDQLKAFRIDLDVGQREGKYPTKEAALTAVDALVERTGLQPTWVVSSGGGFHVYWCLNEPVGRDEWQPVAEQFKQSLVVWGVRADNTITGNLAALLRPIGGVHLKDPANPQSVKALNGRGAEYTLETFRNTLESDYVVQPQATTKAAGSVADSLITAGRSHETPSEVSRIAYMLTKISADNRDNWLRVGSALKTSGWSCGFKMWDEWSAKGKGYAGQSDQYTQWASFEEGRVSLGTIRHLAEQAGWSEVTGAVSISNGSGLLSDIEILRREMLVVLIDGAHRFWLREDAERCDLSQMMKPTDAVFAASRILNASEGVDRDRKTRDLLAQILQSPATCVFKGVTFNPALPVGGAGGDGSAFNLWKGLNVTPDEGLMSSGRCFTDLLADAVREGSGCEHLLSMLWSNLCCQDSIKAEYLWRWLAFAVQRPGMKPEGIVVMQGDSGVGKGTFVRLLERLWGDAVAQTTPESVLGNFNGVLLRSKFLVFDESVFSGDGRTADRLKSLATEPVLSVNQKNKEEIKIPSSHCFILSTNHDHVKKTDRFDRRDFVITPDPSYAGNKEYWGRIYQQLEGSGVRKLLALLMLTPLDKERLDAPPETNEKLEQKLLSLDPIDQVIFEWLKDGRGWIEGTVISAKDVLNVIHDARMTKHPPSTKAVGKRLLKIFPTSPLTRTNTHNGRSRLSLDESRKAFDIYINGNIRWEEA